MQTQFTVRLTADRLDALKARAEFYGLTLADLLRQAIQDGLPITLERLATEDAAKKETTA